MFIEQILKEYQNKFGFKKAFIRNIKKNPYLVLYILIIFGIPSLSVYLFYIKYMNLILGILFIVSYLFILKFGEYQHSKKMYNSIPHGSLGFSLKPFLVMLNDNFKINTNEQLINLDNLIEHEILTKEKSNIIPFTNLLNQMVGAIPITLGLSYALYEWRDGNNVFGNFLLVIYLICIAIFYALGQFLKIISESGSSSKLYEMSYLIKLALLEKSINVNKSKSIDVNRSKSIDIILPPRGDRLRRTT